MTADAFQRWIDTMKARNRARSGADCAKLLGVSPETITRYKRHGTPRTVALACAALAHWIEPFG